MDYVRHYTRQRGFWRRVKRCGGVLCVCHVAGFAGSVYRMRVQNATTGQLQAVIQPLDGPFVTRCRGTVKVNASGVWQPDPLRERPSGLFTHHTCIAPCFSAGEKGPALKYAASMVGRSDRTQVRLTEGALKSGERTRLKAARTVDSRWPHAVCVAGCYNPTACDKQPVRGPLTYRTRGLQACCYRPPITPYSSVMSSSSSCCALCTSNTDPAQLTS